MTNNWMVVVFFLSEWFVLIAFLKIIFYFDLVVVFISFRFSLDYGFKSLEQTSGVRRWIFFFWNMGDLQAMLELFLEFNKFYNVDLFQRGWAEFPPDPCIYFAMIRRSRLNVTANSASFASCIYSQKFLYQLCQKRKYIAYKHSVCWW